MKRLIPPCALAVVLGLTAGAWADWQRMANPPDVDKDYPNMTCWLATAANMLAGAGYGVGDPYDPQARAEAIYQQLVAQFGTDT